MLENTNIRPSMDKVVTTERVKAVLKKLGPKACRLYFVPYFYVIVGFYSL